MVFLHGGLFDRRMWDGYPVAHHYQVVRYDKPTAVSVNKISMKLATLQSRSATLDGSGGHRFRSHADV